MLLPKKISIFKEFVSLYLNSYLIYLLTNLIIRQKQIFHLTEIDLQKITDLVNTIVERLKERDATAMNYLYEHYSSALYGIIFRTLGNEALAEETLHDVFLKIWNQIDKYDATKGNLFTWMYRIARNKAIDVRRSKNFQNSIKSTELTPFVNTFTSETKDDKYGLKELIKKMNEDCIKLINMNFFMGFSHGDISNELEMPLGSVKTKIRSCISKLRALMEKNND